MDKKIFSGVLFVAAAALIALLICYYGVYGALVQREDATPSPAASAETASPSPSPEPTPEEQLFVISMVGDCTLASTQYDNAFEAAVGTDYDWPFSGTLEYFENDYLSLANLECSFSDEAMAGSSTFWFLAPNESARILKSGSVEFVSLANNHTGDFGSLQPAGSEKALNAVGVAWAEPDGAYVFREDGGVSVGVYCAPWLGGVDMVTAGVESLLAKEVDVVVVMMHWGLEGSYRVTAGQEALGRAAIDAGADIVYGSHPHVLQRVEEYGGGYIFYSLGNFSFGGNSAPRDRDTAVAQVTVRRGGDGAVSLSGYRVIPCCLSSTPEINDFRPQPYEPGTPEYQRAMSKLTGDFTGPDLVVDYSAYHSPSPSPEAETPPATPTGTPADGEPTPTAEPSPTAEAAPPAAEPVPETTG